MEIGVLAAVLAVLVHPCSTLAEHRKKLVDKAVLQSIFVETDVDELPVGFSARFRAFGRFSDGQERDITEDVAWTVEVEPGLPAGRPAVRIENEPGRKGLAQRVHTGMVRIVATFTFGDGSTIVGKANFPQVRFGMCEFVEGIFSLIFEPVGRGCREVKSELRQVAIENDVMAIKNEDRFYTNGVFYDQVYFGALQPDKMRRDNYGYRIGQLIFTASKIQSRQPVPGQGDRPFAGYLYFGVFWESFRRDLPLLDYLRLDAELGCTGPCSMAESAQTVAHDLLSIGSDTPQGWQSQIREEVGLNFRGTYAPFTFAIEKSGAADTYWMDLIPLLQAEIGSFFVNHSGTLLTRFSIWGGLRPYISTGSLESAANAVDKRDRDLRVHLFAKYSVRKVLRNALLQGGKFHKQEGNVFTADPDNSVRENAAGIQIGNGKFGFSYTLTRRSSEVKGPPEDLDDEGHYFGKLQFSWILDF